MNLVYLCLALIALMALCHFFGIVLVSYIFTFIGAVLIFQLMASIMLPATQTTRAKAWGEPTNNNSIIFASPVLSVIAVETCSSGLLNFSWLSALLILLVLAGLFKGIQTYGLANSMRVFMNTIRFVRSTYSSLVDFVFKPMNSDGTYSMKGSSLALWLQRPVFKLAEFFGLNAAADTMRSRTQFPNSLAQLEKRL
jgi:hypothetical protein